MEFRLSDAPAAELPGAVYQMASWGDPHESNLGDEQDRVALLAFVEHGLVRLGGALDPRLHPKPTRLPTTIFIQVRD